MGPWKWPAGRHAIDVFHIATFLPSLDVPQRDARVEQRPLEGERAAEEEGDQIVAPERA